MRILFAWISDFRESSSRPQSQSNARGNSRRPFFKSVQVYRLYANLRSGEAGHRTRQSDSRWRSRACRKVVVSANTIIGKSIPLADAPGKVTGKGKYADDLSVAGMLHGRILHSPHA